MRTRMYAHSSRERDPFLDPPSGRRRSAHPPHESWPWAFSDVAGRSIGGICAIPGRRKPTAGKGKSSRPLTRPFPIFTADLSPPTQAPKLAQPLPDLFLSFFLSLSLSLSLSLAPSRVFPTPYSPRHQDDDAKRVPSDSDQEKRKGRAESDESASEKYCGPHGWAAGGGVEAWPRGVDGGSTSAKESAWGGDATP